MKHSLIIDLGNTSVKYAVFAGEKFVCQTKIIIDEFDFLKSKALLRKMLSENKLSPEDFMDAILFSVVPSLNKTISRVVRSVFKLNLKVFELKQIEKLPVGVPEDIGHDLLADMAGGIDLYGAPLMIADLGTVSKFIFINKDKELAGCTFMPGMDASLKSMTRDTELLPKLRIEKPEHDIGLDTIGCMKSGVYHSTVATFDSFAKLAKEKFGNVKTVLTGGYAEVVRDDINCDVYDPLLTVKGINQIRIHMKKE